YLKFATELYVVRVAETNLTSDEAAATADVDVPAAGGLVAIEGSEDPTFSFSTDTFFRWRLNGQLSSKTLVVFADANRDSPNTGDPYSCADLVDDLNSQLDASIDGIQ